MLSLSSRYLKFESFVDQFQFSMLLVLWFACKWTKLQQMSCFVLFGLFCKCVCMFCMCVFC